jgi:hypothetical protein
MSNNAQLDADEVFARQAGVRFTRDPHDRRSVPHALEAEVEPNSSSACLRYTAGPGSSAHGAPHRNVADKRTAVEPNVAAAVDQAVVRSRPTLLAASAEAFARCACARLW